MPRRRSSLVVFALLVLVVGILTAFGPPEATLGTRARLASLHGAGVWTALAAFGAAAATGAAGLVFSAKRLQDWSVALGQAGTFFWVTYLPLSLWTMQANWNGLNLEEPRWRIGVQFAVGALLFQAGVLVLGKAAWASLLIVLLGTALAVSLARVDAVMHPASPILSSGSALIQSFFLALLAVSLLACWLLARWLLASWVRYRHEPGR
jgi:hypothetical protein